ncbi:MAG: ATP-binding protein [Defluviitaleaceae bacterium]|nr:ATP-binding protein [Defluviitaleaceae bacterium]
MSQIFKEVLRGMETQRLRAQRALDARQGFLYEKLPQVKKIDQELAGMGLAMAKLVLRRDDSAAQTEELRRRGEELATARRQLLYDNGYDDTFFEEVYNCVACKDTGFAENTHCHCLKQRLVAKYYEMSNLARVLERENFDAFNINYYSDAADPAYGISPRDNMQRVWAASLKFVENFDKNFENLLFYGHTGLGKTFLSNCIAKELLDSGKTVLYTTAAQLFKLVEEHRFNRAAAENPGYLGIVATVDLLIIDDLGTEFGTIVTTSELFNFINSRLLGRKSTIISTNLTPGELEEHYDDRITSRIYGEYTLLQFFGDDIRIAKKHGLT